MQTAREGRATDLIALLADLEDSGDVIRGPEATDFDSADLEDALDAEIELSDDDDPRLEGWDETTDDNSDGAFVPSKGIVTEPESVELPMRIELLVADGCCRVHRPSWMRAEPRTDSGQEFLDEIGRRFDVLSDIGGWLSLNRKAFLATPDPWLLGVEALNEMRRGHAPVSPGSFLALTGLDKLEAPSQFSRHTTDCFLVWKDGTLPLDFIFGPEARMAWVANAVVQFAAHQGNALTESVLDRFKTITKPRGANAQTLLSSKPVDHLDFGEFIAKANLMANAKWTDVVSAYHPRLLERPS
jgi:hypothetical protein